MSAVQELGILVCRSKPQKPGGESRARGSAQILKALSLRRVGLHGLKEKRRQSNHYKDFFNVYLVLRERERESMSRGGTEREGERKSQADCTLSVQSPTRGSNP